MTEKPFELKLDKTPILVYIQKETHGMGELYLNGKRLTGLQEIEIKAETKTEICFPELKLKIIPKKLAEFGTQEE
jgi:hypothetical protein